MIALKGASKIHWSNTIIFSSLSFYFFVPAFVNPHNLAFRSMLKIIKMRQKYFANRWIISRLFLVVLLAILRRLCWFTTNIRHAQSNWWSCDKFPKTQTSCSKILAIVSTTFTGKSTMTFYLKYILTSESFNVAHMYII